MNIQKVGRYDVAIFRPEGEFDTVLYTCEMRPEGVQAVWQQFENPRFALVAVLGFDWFADLTPWHAKNVFKGAPDFAGNGPALLRYIKEECIPYAEALLGAPKTRGIFGYSLAGLFSVYALYETDLFSHIGCVSGSMWYDGFVDWIKQRRPGRETGRVHFSIGDKEPLTKNARMAICDSCMKQAAELLQTQGFETYFCYNEGDHMDEMPQRCAKAVRWLTESN
ncbi:MAG: alpha/beta hydrolase [Oscillospiraceae bacterium]|nr:alpha/beta hydrolase [Oscillospiraceae bacterium]